MVSRAQHRHKWSSTPVTADGARLEQYHVKMALSVALPHVNRYGGDIADRIGRPAMS